MDYIREAIEYLKSYKDTQMSIINLREEITKLDAELKGSAITYTDMPGGGGIIPADDIMLNKIYRKSQAEKQLKESAATIRRIDRILKDLNSDNNEKHGDMLRKSFIARLSNKDIDELADEFGYSRRQFYRVREKALKRFAIQLFGISVIK